MTDKEKFELDTGLKVIYADTYTTIADKIFFYDKNWLIMAENINKTFYKAKNNHEYFQELMLQRLNRIKKDDTIYRYILLLIQRSEVDLAEKFYSQLILNELRGE